jgi:hypothetical protein
MSGMSRFWQIFSQTQIVEVNDRRTAIPALAVDRCGQVDWLSALRSGLWETALLFHSGGPGLTIVNKALIV